MSSSDSTPFTPPKRRKPVGGFTLESYATLRYDSRGTADTEFGCVISMKGSHSLGQMLLAICTSEYLYYRRTVAPPIDFAIVLSAELCYSAFDRASDYQPIMAPSNSLLTRLKNTLKRITSWRPTKNKAVPEQSRALPDKTSVPEQPQAAPQQPIIHQDQTPVRAASTMPTLQIALKNNSTSNQIFAYVSE